MKRRESNDLKRAYAVWTIAGTSLIVAAVAGSAIFAVFAGTADAGTLVWGVVGIAALLETLVLFGYGLRAAAPAPVPQPGPDLRHARGLPGG